MNDASPSATPMPEPPLATATNPAAPFPPVDSQPVCVPPSVMDPVSNLDFLPVDDAFALEMRSETIDQFVGGDSLRRGESERIEAGRSKTNADRVAGRDRVRVRGTLHEHTGRGRTEKAAHLHITVDGTLDVHAASEDTVLLAGHMRDLWDGGAAIVAAMTDDMVGGGGIRVTTPLDLWVHGLMGVEERIGTCTADAVLTELGATHYEREYGPGAHAAGLAVYTGSLYQSNRSTFRPLMRVASGVRNLIAGGGGGGGGGDAGAGNAPAASPPPASAAGDAGDAGDAGTRGASETLCAATVAAGTVRAGGMAGGRSEDLTGIHPGDEVAALALGANVPDACGDLTELGRSTDTAGQLAALRDAMRGDEAGTQGEVTSVFRVPPLDDTASGNEVSVPDIEAVVRPAATVPDLDAPVLHSTVSPPQRVVSYDPYFQHHIILEQLCDGYRRPSPPQRAPGVKLQLLRGGDPPPYYEVTEYNLLALHFRLEQLCDRYGRTYKLDMAKAFERVLDTISDRLLFEFERFGGSPDTLAQRRGRYTSDAENAYKALSSDVGIVKRYYGIGEAASIAETREAANIREAVNICEAAEIREVAEIHEALDNIRWYAIEEFQRLSKIYDLAEPPPTQAMLQAMLETMLQPPATIRPTVTVAAIPPPAHTRIETDRFSSYRQLYDFPVTSGHPVREAVDAAAEDVSRLATRTFSQLRGSHHDLPRLVSRATRTELAYRGIEGMLRQADEAHDHSRASALRQGLETIDRFLFQRLNELITRYGAVVALPPQTTDSARRTQTSEAMQLPLVQLPPMTVASTTVALAGRLEFPGPAHQVAPEATVAFPQPAGGLVHATDAPGPPPASSLPGPSLSDSEAADASASAMASDLGRARRDPPATVTTAAQPVATEATVTPSPADPSSFWLQPVDPWPAPGTGPVDSGMHHAGETAQPGNLGGARLDPPATVTTAGQPVAAEAIVTPSLTGTSSFWLQPVDPWPAPGAVPFDSGQHHAGEAVQPPPVTATASSAAPAPVPALPAVAGRTGADATALPPGADPSRIRPPGWPRAETPGFGRRASGAVEIPLSRRWEIADRLSSEDGLRRAEFVLDNDDEALRWSDEQVWAVRDGLYLLNAFDFWLHSYEAARIDIDWSTIETLIHLLDAPTPAP